LLCAKRKTENTSAASKLQRSSISKLTTTTRTKEPTMFKSLAVFAALVVFAPLAYAGLYQAALIVA
jgi:hypothetical protein